MATTDAPPVDAGVSPAPAADAPAPVAATEDAAADEDAAIDLAAEIGEDPDADTDAASDAGKVLARRSYRNRIEKRIAAITKEKAGERKAREAADAKVASLQAEIDRLAASGAAPKPVEAAATETPKFETPRPKQDDFEDFEKFLEARDEWVASKTKFEITTQLAAEAATAREAQAKAQAMAEQKAADDAYFARVDKAREKYADFDDVIEANKDLLLPGVVLAHIKASEVGPELLRHLATHHKLAAELAAMGAAGRTGAALVAVGKIEAALEAAATPAPVAAVPETPKPGKTVPVSRAPAPVATIAGRGAGIGPKALDDPSVSQREYNERRDADEARRRTA